MTNQNLGKIEQQVEDSSSQRDEFSFPKSSLRENNGSHEKEDKNIQERLTSPKTSSSRIGRMVQRVFRDYPGNIAIRLWQGETLKFGSGSPDATLIVRDPYLFRELVMFSDPLRLAEAYFQGMLDVKGDIYKVLGLKDHLRSLALSLSEKLSLISAALSPGDIPSHFKRDTSTRHNFLFTRFLRQHSKSANSKAIAFHYDVSNDFYRLWLDQRMIYSCAYFSSPDESLEQAQCNKLDLICRKLRLQSGERLLDIGCGWGALLIWAAQHYGVQAHGITLSRQQYEYCQEKIKQAGLQELVTVEFKDYRDLQGESIYDKIVSVGMFEHVGLKNLPAYFSIGRRLLKPGGLFLNHGITHDSEGWKKTVSTRFINRYVFPDGELDTVSNVQRVMERTGYEILDVESLRPHYAITLRHWVQRLEDHKAEALKIVSEPTYRVWRLYMAACAVQFEQGEIGVHQILAGSRNGGLSEFPLTRKEIYK